MSSGKQENSTKGKTDPRRQDEKQFPKADWRFYVPLLIVILVSYFSYSSSLDNAFVNWDDDRYVIGNWMIQSIDLKELFSTYVMGNYHPVTMLVYSIEFPFFGQTASGYHKVSLLLHLLNTALVCYLFFFLVHRIEIAFITALLFGIHPIHVESVAWVSGLKDMLYTFFFLASCIYYLKYRDNGRRKFYFYAIALFILSLLSKAMAACLPLVLLLFDYYNGQKFNVRTQLDKLPFFVLSIVFGVVAIFAQRSGDAFSDIAAFSFPQRVVFACYGFVSYLVKLVIPLQLSVIYPYPVKEGESIPPAYYGYIAVLVLLVVAVIYSRRFSRKIIFGAGFFTVTIFLVLQLLPVGEAVMADRYAYLPSIGFFYLVAEGIYWVWQRNFSWKYLKTATFILLVVLTVFYSSKTYSRCDVWQDSMTLWNDVLSQNNTIAVAYNNRGLMYMNEKDFEKAFSDFNKAIELDSVNYRAYINMGALLMKENKLEAALPFFNKTIELKSDNSEAYNNRGALFRRMKKYDEAIRDFNKAIEVQPDNAAAFNNRGYLFFLMERFDEAMADYNKAIRINPGIPNVYGNRGSLYRKLKKYNEALRDYEKLVKLDENNADGYFYKGLVEYQLGKTTVGCWDLQQAIELGNENAEKAYKDLCR